MLRELCGATSIDYIYGTEGIAGFIVDKDTNNEATYVYRKNIFGDVTAVYNDDGILQCTYEYDAWGNHVIYDADGKVVDGNSDNIGLINPIRYRGYYFDEETGLYYLKTRYYDPQVGRFMTIDGIEYLDPETINGLNLYAYCNNNPVMNVDPDGNKWWHWLLGGLAIIAMTALAVVTAGVAATIISSVVGIAGTTFISAAMTGAAIGGLVTGGMELISQGIKTNWQTLNMRDVAIETFTGSVYGAISGMLCSGPTPKLRLGLRTSLAITSALNSALHDINHGESFNKIIRSFKTNMTMSMLLQSFMVGLDERELKFNSHIVENYIIDGDLFGEKDALIMTGIIIFKFFFGNFKK